MCRTQFGYLAEILADIKNDHPDLDVSIHAINMVGYETAAQLVFDVADLPVLQDDSAAHVMNDWGATQRDFFILGGDNEEVDRFNLTMDDLSNNANRARVTAALVNAARDIE